MASSKRKMPRLRKSTKGTPKTRRMQRLLAKNIHLLTCDKSRPEGADYTGLSINDIRNLREGNLPSLRHLIAIVKTIKVKPTSLLAGTTLEPLPKGKRVRGVDLLKVCERIRKIVLKEDPITLSNLTGLPVGTIHQYRSKDRIVGLRVFLGFVCAGYSADELILG